MVTIQNILTDFVLTKDIQTKTNSIGGTILIDASGSMSFDGKDILDILQPLPAATIHVQWFWKYSCYVLFKIHKST